MFELFQYDFVLRGMTAGIIVGAIAPLLGIFLVLKRYALIADTLAHVALAGVAIGLLFGAAPLLAGIATALVASFFIERMRASRRVTTDSGLSLFLSGSLALAIVLLSVSRNLGSSLFGYLFGSILTVRTSDVVWIGLLGLLVLIVVVAFFREFVYVTFDEVGAHVAGVRTHRINALLILLAGLTVSFSIPIIGSLLVAALLVIPVVAALQLRRGFAATLLIAEGVSLSSVLAGIVLSYFMDIPAGGATVLLTLAWFGAFTLLTPRRA